MRQLLSALYPKSLVTFFNFFPFSPPPQLSNKIFKKSGLGQDASGRSGSAEHGRTSSIGRSEVRDESGDGEGAAGRSGYDGQELTGDGTLEEFGVEGVAREIRSIAAPLAGVVVNQLHQETKSSQENR